MGHDDPGFRAEVKVSWELHGGRYRGASVIRNGAPPRTLQKGNV